MNSSKKIRKSVLWCDFLHVATLLFGAAGMVSAFVLQNPMLAGALLGIGGTLGLYISGYYEEKIDWLSLLLVIASAYLLLFY